MKPVHAHLQQTSVADQGCAEALFRSLECYFCNNMLTCPKECECGHVFCMTCLQDHMEYGPKGFVKCPLCFRILTVSDGGANDLPTQLFYRDLAQEVRSYESGMKYSRDSCKFCNDNEKQPAAMKCLFCHVPMCEECSSHHMHNGISKVEAIHQRQDSLLCDVLPKRVTACNNHQTESLHLYCVACKSCVCFKCKNELHATHTVLDLADTAATARDTIADVHSKLKQYINETNEALLDIDRISKEYSENVDATKIEIETQMQSLIDHIQNEKERMIMEIETHAKDIQKRLLKCQHDMRSKDSRAQSFADLTRNLMLFGNDAENTTYKSNVEKRWMEIEDSKLIRFGQGYSLKVQYAMAAGLKELLAQELGSISVTQNLSPWTGRKSKPINFEPLDPVNVVDVSTFQQKMRSAVSNEYSLKRSQIFAKFVDPKWNLETYKTNKISGQTVTVWLKMDEDAEASRSSKRISMRSISSPCLLAVVESFSEKGECQYKKTIDKLPDGTIIRLAIGGKDTIMLAVYPGYYASSVIGQAKLRSLSKKDVDGIYVAIMEKGEFKCGEVRRIPIPEGPSFDFEISSKGMIIVRSLLNNSIKLYSSYSTEVVTDYDLNGLIILQILESPDNEIVVVCKDKDGNHFCDILNDSGECQKRLNFFSAGSDQLVYEFREIRFDRHRNLLVHLYVSTSDVIYQVIARDNRKECLSKPDMLHKVDKLAVLPDGRLCVFDKAECVLMTLRYL